jgi:hypothetical protein
MLQNIRRDIATALFLTLPIGVMLVCIDSKPAFAGCNPFGCSQSSVAECNPFGCPNVPLGQACTPFGCPASPQPQNNNTSPTVIFVPQNQGVQNQGVQNQGVTIRPSSQAGNYWVYQKPSNLTEDQMIAAGAAYYSSPQACSMHYSLCTTLGGVWLSTQQSLTMQFPQNAPVNLQPQPDGGNVGAEIVRGLFGIVTAGIQASAQNNQPTQQPTPPVSAPTITDSRVSMIQSWGFTLARCSPSTANISIDGQKALCVLPTKGLRSGQKYSYNSETGTLKRISVPAVTNNTVNTPRPAPSVRTNTGGNGF